MIVWKLVLYVSEFFNIKNILEWIKYLILSLVVVLLSILLIFYYDGFLVY